MFGFKNAEIKKAEDALDQFNRTSQQIADELVALATQAEARNFGAREDLPSSAFQN